MLKKDASPFPQVLDRFALERRRFLSEGALYGAGAVSILAALGLSRYAVAQSSPPAAGAGPGARPPMPPEPAVSQPPPLHGLKGKVAYITASASRARHPTPE
jgi:hypothetical protein